MSTEPVVPPEPQGTLDRRLKRIADEMPALRDFIRAEHGPIGWERTLSIWVTDLERIVSERARPALPAGSASEYVRHANTRCNMQFATGGGGARICVRAKGHDGSGADHTDQPWLADQLDAPALPAPEPPQHDTDKLDALANDYADRRNLSQWDRSLVRSFISWLPIADTIPVAKSDSGAALPAEHAPPDRDRIELMAARAGNENRSWCTVHDSPRARFECRECFDELAAIALGSRPALAGSPRTERELRDGLYIAAALLCETRRHAGRRPCTFCIEQIIAPYSEENIAARAASLSDANPEDKA